MTRWGRATRAACRLAGVLVGTLAPAVQAQLAPQWVTQQWTVEDGLPVDGVTDVRFGPGGYLYLTTFDGLVRFDGRDFVTYTVGTHPALPSNRFVSFVPSAPDELLFVTEQNELVRMHEGTFTSYHTPFSLPPLGASHYVEVGTLRSGWFSVLPAVYLPGSGTHYLGTSDGLMKLEAGEMKGLLAAFPNVRFFKSREGEVFFITEDALYALRDERPAEIGPFPNQQRTFQYLRMDREGRFWAASLGLPVDRPHALIRADARDAAAGRWQSATLPGQADARDVTIANMWLDAGGAVWVLTSDGGLYRQRGTSFQAASPAAWPGQPAGFGVCESPPVPVVREPGGPVVGLATCYDARFAPLARFVQAEGGALWAATEDQGLIRVTQSPITAWAPQDVLSTASAYAVLRDAAGRLWVGSFDPAVECIGEGCPPVPASFRTSALSFHIDRNGDLLMGGISSLWRFDGRALEPIALPYGDLGYVRALDTDARGRLWAGSEVGLLVGRPDGNGWAFTRYLDELTHRWVRVIRTTRDGTRWLGTNGGGLMRVEEEPGGALRFEPFTTRQGLCSDNVRDLYEDAEGLLWVATEDRGLCRVDLRRAGGDLARARITNIRRADGLFDDGIHNILEDAAGRFWMGTNRGLFWTPRADLEAFAAGRTANVFAQAYTERDGLLNREFNGGVQPSAWKDEEGLLWFASQGGIVRVDPGAVRLPSQPQARLQAVYVNGQARPAAGLRLEPDERDLAMDFTSLYFGNPEEVRYRYRLVGYSDAWQLAREERTAAYTNLSPGSYRFEVQAGRGDVWSEPAVLAFERRAAFSETRAFAALLALLALGLVSLGVWGRLRRVRLRNEQLEEAVTRATVDLQDANERLREAHTAKDQFLANISHEFRTPLTLTYGPINDLLDGRYAVAEEARPLLEQARRNGARLHRLINQLLELSRLDHGATTLECRPHDLAAFLRHRVAAFEAIAREYSLALRLHLPAAPVPFAFDEPRLETVVLNLLSNAFKFTPPGGQIHVGLHLGAAGEAVISVRDTGEGIAPEHLPHLFDRFYQVDGSTTRRREGTGIGLALAQQLVKLHGGALTVASTPGEGTTFTVTLPAAAGAAAGAAVRGEDASGAEPAPDLDLVEAALPACNTPPARNGSPGQAMPAEEDADTRPLVLVVEDNADMRAYIRSQLHEVALVEEAENGAVGVERALELVPDLVVSDVMMPLQDGYDLLAALKADLRTSHIPVVLLTARADAESRLAGLEGGADDYLAKPFDGGELRARVRNLIEGRRALRALWGRSAFSISANAVEMPSAESAFLKEVKAAIEARMADAGFGPYELADTLAMSPRQLRRKLGGLIDETPNRLINRFRLERAAALLAQEAGGIKEVAAAVGFGSTSRFSAAFREHFGVAPSQYRPDPRTG